MKIKRVQIHNYRSIRDLDVICEPMLILLGPNNHGKSNILSAIEFGLSPNVKPSISDLNVFCGDDKSFWVEITFHDLSEQEKITFKKYYRQDGTICIRKSANLTEDGKIEIGIRGYIQEPDEPWLCEIEVAKLANRDAISGTPLTDYVSPTGRVPQESVREAQRKYIEDHQGEISYHEALEITPFMGPKNIGGGILPDFYLIPAVRDLSDETKTKGTSTFGKLLGRTIQEMAERDPTFQELRLSVDKLINRLNRADEGVDSRPTQLIELEKTLENELTDWSVDVEIEVIPPQFEKFFEMGTNLHVNDGVKTTAENKGHGLQRALIFALVRAWAKTLRAPVSEPGNTVPRTSSDSVIFAIEEPELFLHPHAQKRMAKALNDIAASQNHQVLVCSHSSYFVDLDQYKSICIVNKENSETGTVLRQCSSDLFEGASNQEKKDRFHAAHWINPDRGEIFFAKKIVFVEGETEKVILPYLAQKLNCFNYEISIIDCGSKFNLPLYITIANAFKLSYTVIHDEDPIDDPIPSDWNQDKIREKNKTFALNHEINELVDFSIGNIHIFSPDFEGISGISRSQGKNKGKPIAALEYFSTINETQIPECLRKIVQTIFT